MERGEDYSPLPAHEEADYVVAASGDPFGNFRAFFQGVELEPAVPVAQEVNVPGFVAGNGRPFDPGFQVVAETRLRPEVFGALRLAEPVAPVVVQHVGEEEGGGILGPAGGVRPDRHALGAFLGRKIRQDRVGQFPGLAVQVQEAQAVEGKRLPHVVAPEIVYLHPVLRGVVRHPDVLVGGSVLHQNGGGLAVRGNPVGADRGVGLGKESQLPDRAVVKLVGKKIPGVQKEGFRALFRDLQGVLAPAGHGKALHVALQVADEKVAAAEEDDVVGLPHPGELADAGVHYLGVGHVLLVPGVVLPGKLLDLGGVRQFSKRAILSPNVHVPHGLAFFVPKEGQGFPVGGESQ